MKWFKRRCLLLSVAPCYMVHHIMSAAATVKLLLFEPARHGFRPFRTLRSCRVVNCELIACIVLVKRAVAHSINAKQSSDCQLL